MNLVVHGPDLQDYHGVFALFRHGGATVSVPSGHARHLSGLLARMHGECTPEALAGALAEVADRVIGPAYIGYAAEVAMPGTATAARSLDPGDEAAVEALQAACDPTEWEHGGSDVVNTCSGVFMDGRLATLAGYEVWGGTVAHISIVAHPAYRGRGLARDAVAHVACRALEAGLIPQYRTLEANRASVRIAESLGFRLYARSLAVRLRADLPSTLPR